MSFIYSALTVANIAEAKALNATTKIKRVDELFLVIADTGSGFPGWYRYSADSFLEESLPTVFRSNDGEGAWLQFSPSPVVDGGVKSVLDLGELRLAEKKDGAIISVQDDGEGDRAFYQFVESATDDEVLPTIVAVSGGRWYQFPKPNYSTKDIDTTSSASIVANLRRGDRFSFTLRRSDHTLTATNIENGTYVFFIKQTSAPQPLTFGSMFKVVGTVSNSANAIDIMRCESDGTNLYCKIESGWTS